MRASALLLLCAAAFADTVVLRDRIILTGPVTADGEMLTVGSRKVPLARVLLWEDGNGKAMRAASLEAHLQALGALAEQRSLAVAKEAYPAAISAGDPAAARVLLERAKEAGLDPKQAEEWSKQLAGIEGKTPAQPFAVPPDMAWEELLLDRARKAQEAGDQDRAAQLLRALLLRNAAYEPATAQLQQWLPERWKWGDARNWLEWRALVLPGGVRVVARSNPDMERARNLWRPEIFGVETPEVVLITSLQDAGPVSKCQRLAGLTCRALESIFRTDKPEREEFDPLVIYFYATKQEYEQKSGTGTPQAGHGIPLGLTLGHYSPAENISRFYWFQRPDAESVVTETFVHELTHHWIERRCPRFHFRDMMRDGLVPGFWIVEGFAVFMQEGRYDPDRGAWSNWNSHAATLDTVATLGKAGKLIPWEKLYPLNQAEFQNLGKEFNIKVERRWSLQIQGFSETNLFYQQAGATCQFLFFGENGAYRERLLEFVKSYYTGRKEGTGIEAAFGLAPADLGAKVLAFAEAVQKGWRPAR